jgi:hypothetical protein
MKQMATFSGAGWNIANTGGSSAVWRIYEGNTTPLLRSFLKPLPVYPDGTYAVTGVDATHVFGSGTGIYSDQQGYDISFVPAPVIPPVVKPSDDVKKEVELELKLENKLVININQFNLNFFLSQLTSLQNLGDFISWYNNLSSGHHLDNIDVDFGQYKGDSFALKTLGHEWRSEHGKQSEYEKKDDLNDDKGKSDNSKANELKAFYQSLLILIQNGGIKLPAELLSLIPPKQP